MPAAREGGLLQAHAHLPAQQQRDHDPGVPDANEPQDQTQPRQRHVTIAEERSSSAASPSTSPAGHAQRAASVHGQASSGSSTSSHGNSSRQQSSKGASTSMPASRSHHASRRRSSKAAIPRMLAYKLSPEQQVQAVFKEVLHLLEAEWPTIRSLNLGEPVQSSQYK